MKELIPYIFEHPQYGKLRVVVEEDRIYYDLFDVKRIFVKTAQQLFEVIADSEGELKNFNVVMKPMKKNQHNLFYSDDAMGVEAAGRKKNVAANFNFCDEKLVADMVDAECATEKTGCQVGAGVCEEVCERPCDVDDSCGTRRGDDFRQHHPGAYQHLYGCDGDAHHQRPAFWINTCFLKLLYIYFLNF